MACSHFAVGRGPVSARHAMKGFRVLLRSGETALFASLIFCCGTTVYGSKINRSTSPPILLRESERFVARDAWNGVALYRVNDLAVIRRFRAPGTISVVAVTSYDKLLLFSCRDGSHSD